jgi:hypothetical protein
VRRRIGQLRRDAFRVAHGEVGFLFHASKSSKGIRMKHLSSVIAVSGLVLAVGAMLAPITANAATSPRRLISNPAGVCQGALPAFETAIRKRPLAVQNEGTSNAFVTCSFTSQGNFGGSITNPTSVEVYFNSISGADVEISCTGVSGFVGGGNQFLVKNATALANGSQAVLTWVAADFSGAPANFPSGLFSISCNIPPGGAINDTYVFFAEEIGT